MSTPATTPERLEAGREAAPSLLSRALALSTVGPLIALLLAIAFFTARTDRFLTGTNLSLVVQQVMVVGTLAIGQTLVTSMRLPPFIVTLGTLNVAFALTHIYSNEQTISNLPSALTFLGTTFTIGQTDITYGSVLMLAMFALAWFVLRQTSAGRHVYAVGNNPEAARLTGIRHRRPDLRRRRAAAGRPDQRRRPPGGPDRQPRQHHRGRARRHQPVRRAGERDRHPDRRADRRHRPQRPATARRTLDLPGPHHRHAGDPRRRRRPARPQEAKVIPAVTDRQPTRPPSTTPVMEARGLVKRYGQVTALDHADFELLPGEILAIIGDNGAGKSTLIKALSGALVADEGEILLDGSPVRFHGPLDARRHGIETVYQDLAVAPALDIADNLFLGREIRRPGVLGSVLRMIDHGRMLAESRRHMADLKIGIRSMGQAVETLSGGQRQGVAVARSAAFARHVVIMDEPTAALGVKETHMVLDLIRKVRDRGLPVILISHNMPIVFEVADRVHIQRLGRRVAVISPPDFRMSDAVAIMTGAMAGEEVAK